MHMHVYTLRRRPSDDRHFQIRETFESALAFGTAALRELGVPADEAAGISDDVRSRDAERFSHEIAGGGYQAGIGLLRTNVPKPAPLVTPQREGRSLNEADGATEPVASFDGAAKLDAGTNT